MQRPRHNSAASSVSAAREISTANSSSHHHRRRRDADDDAQEMSAMYDYLAKIILLGPSGCGKSCLLHRFVKGDWRVLSSHTVGVEFASKIVKIGGPRRKRIKLQLWDTAGTERFRSVSRSYYRGAAGAVLVYDVCDPASFRALPDFLHDARALGSPHLSVILAGNKSDLLDPASAVLAEQQQYPQSHSLLDTGENDDDDGSSPARLGTSISSTPVRSAAPQLRATTTTSSSSSGVPRTIPASLAANWASEHLIPASVHVSALSGDGVDELFQRLARSILTKLELGEIDPDDPRSGIQYGDADYYYGHSSSRFPDDASSTTRSRSAAGGGLTSDGFSPAVNRRRRRKTPWSDVLRLKGRPGSSGSGTAGGGGDGGRCC